MLADLDAIVVDVAGCSAAPITLRLWRYLSTHPQVGLVVVGMLTPALAQLAAQVRVGRTVAISLHDTGAARAVWRATRRVYLASLPERVLLALAPGFLTLTPSTVHAIRRAFLGEPITTVPELAAAAGMSARTLYRHFARAGLEQPKDLLRAAGFVRHLPLLYRQSRPLNEVYRAFGYSAYGDFQWHMRRLLGVSPRAARYDADPTRFPAQIVRAVLTTPRTERVQAPRAGRCAQQTNRAGRG